MAVGGIEAILYSAHGMLAVLTKTPEFALDNVEAKMLAEGVARVADHYDAGVVSQKTMDWIALAQVAAMVYGPRIAAIRVKKTRARAEAAQATAANPMDNLGGWVPPMGGEANGVQ